MGLMALAMGRRALERTFVDAPAQWLVEMFGGGASATGLTVTPATSMRSTAVYACVRVLAEDVSSLPLLTYERLASGGKQRAPDHPLYPILHDSPNPEMTSMEWRELQQGHLALRGNAYSEIVRDNGGRVRELWPLHPDRTTPVRTETGALVYRVKVPDALAAREGRQEVLLSADRVLHLRGLSSDGVLGLSPIQMAMEAVGLTLAVEEYGARFFGHNAQPGGVLEHPGKLSQEAAARLKADWEAKHAGLSQAHRVAILEEGLKWSALSIPNEQAQFLETRQFQVGEIARLFRVMGVKIGHNDKTSTYASAEQFFLAHVVDTLRPWLVRWEQALMLKLLTPGERQRYFIEHLIDGMLRGDAASRATALHQQWTDGALTIDEWREIENRNPMGGRASEPFVPLNMIPLSMAGDVIAKRQPTAPAAPAAASARAASILEDAIARAVRREVQEVRRGAQARAGDVPGWRAWVDEFYARHRAYLAESLHVSLDRARSYAEEHRAALLAEGLAVLDTWDRTGPAALRALVDEEVAA